MPQQHSDEALFRQARALQRARRWRDAVAPLRRLLDRFPNHPVLLAELGMVVLRAGDAPGAVRLLERSVARAPDEAQPRFALGVALATLGRHRPAVAQFDRALALRPGHASTHLQKGAALLACDEPGPALEAFERALALEPNDVDALVDRGAALKSLGRFDEALASVEQALARAPSSAAARYGRGALLRDLGRFDEARVDLERALALDPACAEAHAALGMQALLDGEFDDGWQRYEWRWRDPSMRRARRAFAAPCWSGCEPVSGRTVLLHAEQGLGDALQFCRYAPRVAALGARVVLEVPAVLEPLMHTLAGDVEVVARGAALPAFDLHCPLMSLPLAFGTRLETIPAQLPYLSAHPDDVRAWQRRLGPAGGPRIGLAWSGNQRHPVGRKRSVPLGQLAPLLALPFEFHALQPELLGPDAHAAPAYANLRLHGPALSDFAQTAALVALMDRVICVDTAVAHLAGALGRAPWILLPRVADWRWMRDRDDSPWYPGARLFRQTAREDWSDVVGSVVARLSAEGDFAVAASGRAPDARQ